MAVLNTISVDFSNPEVRFHIGTSVPNLESERVMLPVKVSTEGSIVAVVTDITGIQYFEYTVPVVKGSNLINLDDASRAPGSFFYRTLPRNEKGKVIQLVVVR